MSWSQFVYITKVSAKLVVLVFARAARSRALSYFHAKMFSGTYIEHVVVSKHPTSLTVQNTLCNNYLLFHKARLFVQLTGIYLVCMFSEKTSDTSAFCFIAHYKCEVEATTHNHAPYILVHQTAVLLMHIGTWYQVPGNKYCVLTMTVLS